MPLTPPPQTHEHAQNYDAADSDLEATSPASAAAGTPSSSQATSSWASTQGVITHSLYWLQGKSNDTVLVNPNFTGTNAASGYTIYCIHGTADGSYAFKKLIDRLLTIRPGKATNWLPNSISEIHLLAFKGEFLGISIEDYAEQLKGELIKTGNKNIIFFGHSRGGIVAAHFTETMAADIDVTVHGVLAFCSPFAGSSLATFPLTAISTSVAEMQSDSTFLQHLRESMTRTAVNHQKYFYFVAEKDFLVSPDSSAIKEHAANITIMPNHGHLSILTSHKILTPIRHYLKKITKQPLAQTLATAPSINTACLALQAEIIDLKYRHHVYSSENKIKILKNLHSLLHEMCSGNRGEHFPETNTVGDFIHHYLQTIDPHTQLSLYKIIEQNLNPPLSFWETPTAKSKTFIEKLIRSYQEIPLPIACAPITVPAVLP